LLTVVAVAFSGVAFSVAEQGRKPDSDQVITLKYGWPEGMQATMSMSKKFLFSKGEEKQIQNVNEHYHLSTVPYEQGLELKIEFLKVDVEDSGDAKSEVRQFLKELMNLTPNYILSENGEFAGLIGLPELVGEMENAISDMGGHLPDEVSNRLRDMVRKILNRETFEESSKERWNRIVEQWIGLTLTKGVAKKVKRNARLIILPGMEVPIETSYTYHGRVPCNDQETRRECVKLEATSVLGPEKMGEVLDIWSKNIGLDESPYEKIETQSRLEIVTEPDTLLPHKLSMRRLISGVFRIDGHEKSIRQTDLLESSYQYEYPEP